MVRIPKGIIQENLLLYTYIYISISFIPTLVAYILVVLYKGPAMSSQCTVILILILILSHRSDWKYIDDYGDGKRIKSLEPETCTATRQLNAKFGKDLVHLANTRAKDSI